MKSSGEMRRLEVHSGVPLCWICGEVATGPKNPKHLQRCEKCESVGGCGVSAKKTYIGDSVYAAFDGYQIVLTTENGYGASNEICLDSHVLQSLLSYVEIIHGVTIKVEKTSAVDETSAEENLA